MINLIVWCTMFTTDMDGDKISTAMRGKVIKEYQTEEYGLTYLVDFSEYAKQQGYGGKNNTYKSWEIPEYLCIKDKK